MDKINSLISPKRGFKLYERIHGIKLLAKPFEAGKEMTHTNVTPEYRKAEQAFRAAKTIDEKIELLEDMISLLPKHKGTDHLYADLKRRMSKLRRQLESSGDQTRPDP